VQTLDNLAPRIEAIARQLEVPPPTIAKLREHAQRTQQYDRMMRLDALEENTSDRSMSTSGTGDRPLQ
jgi:hypothetical protein